MNAQQIILTIAGTYNLTMSMMMSTRNAPSAFVFKILPFFIGLACLWGAWVLK